MSIELTYQDGNWDEGGSVIKGKFEFSINLELLIGIVSLTLSIIALLK